MIDEEVDVERVEDEIPSDATNGLLRVQGRVLRTRLLSDPTPHSRDLG